MENVTAVRNCQVEFIVGQNKKAAVGIARKRRISFCNFHNQSCEKDEAKRSKKIVLVSSETERYMIHYRSLCPPIHSMQMGNTSYWYTDNRTSQITHVVITHVRPNSDVKRDEYSTRQFIGSRLHSATVRRVSIGSALL